MNNAVVPMENIIQAYESEFQEVVSSNEMKFKQESLFALQQLQKGAKKNKESYAMTIARSNPMSLKFAIMNVAGIGISLSPAQKQAYLVPRDGHIVLDISYMGLCHLAQRSGAVKWVQARLTYSKDRFMLRDIGQQPIHEYDPRGNRGEVDGVYCVAFTGTSYLVDFMTIEEVYAIREKSDGYKKNPQYSPWTTYPTEMIKKTVVKRAAKMWPATEDSRLHAAIDVLNQHQGITFENEEPIATPETLKDVRDLLAVMGKEEESFCNHLRDIIDNCPQDLVRLSDLTESQLRYAHEALLDIYNKYKDVKPKEQEAQEDAKEEQVNYTANDIEF